MSEHGEYDLQTPDDFWTMAKQPEFPDDFTMQIERPEGDDPRLSFSEEGIENLRDQLMKFLLARMIATHKRNGGQGPKKMRARIKLDFDPGHPQQDAGPYYHVIDGENRKEAMR